MLSKEKIAEHDESVRWGIGSDSPDQIQNAVASLEKLVDSALRLAAIEGAGDGEVEKLLQDILLPVAAAWDLMMPREKQASNEARQKLRDLMRSRNQVIAELREMLQWVWAIRYDGKSIGALSVGHPMGQKIEALLTGVEVPDAAKS